MVLFDVQQRTAVAELSCPFLKYAVWSSDLSQVALLSKHAIILADKRLQNSCTGVLLLVELLDWEVLTSQLKNRGIHQ